MLGQIHVKYVFFFSGHMKPPLRGLISPAKIRKYLGWHIYVLHSILLILNIWIWGYLIVLVTHLTYKQLFFSMLVSKKKLHICSMQMEIQRTHSEQGVNLVWIRNKPCTSGVIHDPQAHWFSYIYIHILEVYIMQ